MELEGAASPLLADPALYSCGKGTGFVMAADENKDLPGISEHVQDTGYTMYNENYEVIGNTYSSNYQESYLEGRGCEEGHLRVLIDVSYTAAVKAIIALAQT